MHPTNVYDASAFYMKSGIFGFYSCNTFTYLKKNLSNQRVSLIIYKHFIIERLKIRIVFILRMISKFKTIF